MKIVSLIEANTVNAVAKGAIEFVRTVRQMAESGAADPLEVVFITYDRRLDHRENPNEFVLASRAAGIEIEVIPEHRRFDLSTIPRLRQFITDRRPDLIITHSVKSHFLIWRSGLANRYAWLAFHHGYTTTDRKMRIYNRLDRWSLPKADQLLTVCQPFARELAALAHVPSDRILVQHNAIRPKASPPAEVIDALRTHLNIGSEETVVLAVGRLSKEKAHADLIAAFDELQSRISNLACRLVIVGEGPERAKLDLLAQHSRSRDRMVLVGAVRDVQPFYGLADVFVLPSRSEGSPNVLLEAMAAEVPVVATAVGGVPEIVTDEESALLVSANDPTAMAEAIARVLQSQELARTLVANAQELVKRQHQPELYARNLMKIYDAVVKSRQNRASN